MEINENNKKEYVRRAVKEVIKSYSYQWLTDSELKRSCNIKKTVNKCSEAKMEQIKQCIYEASYIHENLWYAFEEIKDFRDIKELLNYISDVDYYDPATTFLHLVRCSRKVKVRNDKKADSYRIAW